jgi:3-deoxy-D-manno-octulosonate 8-phosphate phosphatase (KDO 8-P phosphatase)
MASPTAPPTHPSSAVPDPARRDRLSRVRLLVLDVDGVMTDGSVMALEGGGELYRFNVKDGAGIVLARQAGLEVGILTGRTSTSVERRARELGIHRLLQGALDKGRGLGEMLADGAYSPGEVAYMGDDILDLPAFRMAGFCACPADAHPLVVKRAHYVCSRPGGAGAVREFIDLILSAKGLMEGLEKRYWEGRPDA